MIFSNHLGLVGAKVSQLMIPGTRVWDEEIIKDLFHKHDRRSI